MKRRDFIRASTLAGGGMLLHANTWASLLSPAAAKKMDREVNHVFALNAFLKITSQNQVLFQVSKHEMGQGIATGMAMILAEELDADWEKVQVEFIDADLKVFQNNDMGGMSAGGSTTIMDMWLILRRMGATARQLLVRAAVQEWSIAPEKIKTQNGILTNTLTGAQLTYGQLADKAALLPLPATVPLKKETDFQLVGQPLPNKITAQVATGTYKYGIDVEVPGMLYALVARCPVHLGKLEKYDASKALKIKGVRHVVTTTAIAGAKPNGFFSVREGVAVVADSFWAAKKGRDALILDWDLGPHGNRSLQDFEKTVQEKSTRQSQPTGFVGNAHAFADLQQNDRILSAEYVYPHQLHASLETLNCTAHHQGDSCEIWVGTQAPPMMIREVAAYFKLPQDQVKIHTLPSGGGFGRRYYPDPALEAVHISKMAGNIPIKMLWTRADDFQHNFWHCYSFSRYQAGLTADKKLNAWYFKELRSYTWGAAFPFRPEISWNGYAIPNKRFDFETIQDDSPVQSCAWRSVIANAWGFGQECFLDEIAAFVGKDPYVLRQELLQENREEKVGHQFPLSSKRLRQVMELAVSKSTWHQKREKGKGVGLAVYPYLHGNSYCAQVAEVTVTNGQLSVDKMVVAVDCGRVVNPDLVKAQIEGGIVWALTALLYGGMELEKGRALRSNFHDNKLLTNAECPEVEVHFVSSEDGPFGIGELSPPSAVPAIVNAIYNATGKRIRKLPLAKDSLV
ncbi:xanthine dehydrogenase family protein molybdopterin-binding subunit [Rufibacter sp. LB8]|uniref:xanthine dehydrogenase family protein molybdopterin-binding subunit n=1 Tax=Rufibacter sp. LB8 TaxID=2777781 RepID=UPI00178C5D26|nr:molybdopterin cofactor-binding domain-containing protein [Rufibacter sp. LB8]